MRGGHALHLDIIMIVKYFRSPHKDGEVIMIIYEPTPTGLEIIKSETLK